MEKVFSNRDYIESFSRGRVLSKSMLCYWVDVLNKLISQDSKNKIILDACCGFGRFTFPFSEIITKYDHKLVGIDKSCEMIEFCNKKKLSHGIDNVEFIQGDILKYKFNCKFDIIFISEAIHLFNDISTIANIFYNLLNYGGFIVLRTISHESIKKIEWLRYFDGLIEQDCQRTPDVIEIINSLNACGFNDTSETKFDESIVFNSSQEYLYPIKEKAYSILHSIDVDSFEKGIRKLEEYLSGMREIPHTFTTTCIIGVK